MFKNWETEMADLSLRLRITLQQAAWTGLTQYTTILKMFTEHPEFPWGQVAAILPADWANFIKAVKAVGEDAYFGFRPNIKEAAAANFLSLAYVAKEMMVKIGGREGSAIGQYRGWISNPRGRTALDKLVAEWDPSGVKVENLKPDEGAVERLLAATRGDDGPSDDDDQPPDQPGGASASGTAPGPRTEPHPPLIPPRESPKTARLAPDLTAMTPGAGRGARPKTSEPKTAAP